MKQIESLIKLLDTQSDNTASLIIAKLVKQGSKVIPLLIESAKNKKSPRIRKWSLEALGVIADPRAAPILVDALNDERMTVRLHALKGLGKMKYRKGISQITKLLKDESGGIRVNALYVLMEIGDRKSLSAILKWSMSDPHWYVRQNACVACELFGAVKAKGKLAAIAKSDERKAVRLAAAKALASLK